jgi:16S rRNA (cytosine967-C5)-methyltransferase
VTKDKSADKILGKVLIKPSDKAQVKPQTKFSRSSSSNSAYPRDLAVRALVRVLTGHEPLDEVLATMALQFPSLPHSWLQEICAGTLRWKGRLDSILDSVSIKKKPSGWLRKVLLIGAYQLVVQDRTPAGAVVSETVDEVRIMEGDAPAGFANACLRKIADHATEFRNQEFQETFDEKAAAAWASMPVWLWNKIFYQQGAEWAREFAIAALSRPTLWLRSREPSWSAPWAVAGPIPCSWQVTEGGPIIARDGFAEGDFLVQDISSQYLVAQVAEKVFAGFAATGDSDTVSSLKKPGLTSTGGGDTVSTLKELGLTALDLCAAPGGKSVNLAWSGFHVTATDRTEGRIPLLKSTISRTASEIELLEWKDLSSCEPKHLVWVDAPCSGTGIIRRHPDVRWLKEEKDLPALTKTQRELILQGWDKVLPGGYLVYSVCSILKEEGPQAIAALGLKDSVVAEWLLCPQTAPHGDGFWAALLRKN